LKTTCYLRRRKRIRAEKYDDPSKAIFVLLALGFSQRAGILGQPGAARSITGLPLADLCFSNTSSVALA